MAEDTRLRVKLLTAGALLPRRADQGAVGYDLHADLSGFQGGVSRVQPHTGMMVPTGIALALPPNVYGRIAPRSGLAAKHGIDVLAGVVDPSYRGEVKIILHNHGGFYFPIKHGDRVAQLLLERVETPDVLEVDALDDTERGSAGFGSSGI